MSDFYKEMLQKSIERQAREITSKGATEHDRYGHLLDAFNGRDLEQEEADRRQEIISRIHNNAEAGRVKREKEAKETREKLQRIVRNVEDRDRRNADAFVDKYKAQLDKAHETIKKEQSKYYFS